MNPLPPAAAVAAVASARPKFLTHVATAAVALAATAAAAVLPAPAVHAQVSLNFTGRYTATFRMDDPRSAEISAYDPASQQLFVINAIGGGTAAAPQPRLDVLSLVNPAAPSLVTSFALPGIPNSVAARNGVIAVATENAANRQDPGTVSFYNAIGTLLTSQTVGAVPDMITFTPNGRQLLVANEAEPNSYNQTGSVDPVGSVSILGVTLGAGTVTVNSNVTAGFAAFNGQAAALRATGVRIYGPNASVAQDLEPEYIAVSPDSQRAFVTLQENNAIATVNLTTGIVESVRGLGLKDHSLAGNGLDASDQDGPNNGPAINIVTQPVRGMYQPDTVATFVRNGQTYLLTANEGDARNYAGFNEETRVNAAGYVLDPTAFPNAATLKQNANLGRLTVTNAPGLAGGDTDGDGDIDQIQSFGGRSFSVLNADTGALVYDSGDDLEVFTAAQNPANFNANSTGNALDNRSDDKGPEPEGVVIGEAFGLTLGFVALERVGGILMLDLADPNAPVLLQFLSLRDFGQTPGQGAGGDLGPEGLLFISAADSPSGEPLLVVTNEVSGTTTILTLAAVPEPGTWALLAFGGAAAVAAAVRRRRQAV